MRYLLKCKACGATGWADGEDDPDTNGFEVDHDRPVRWEPESACGHDDYDVIDSEYPDSEHEPGRWDF